MKTPRFREKGMMVALVMMKTPEKGKLPKRLLRLTQMQSTMGMTLQKMIPMALMSAVIILRPGGLENMNFLTIQRLKMLRNVQIRQNAIIIELSILVLHREAEKQTKLTPQNLYFFNAYVLTKRYVHRGCGIIF